MWLWSNREPQSFACVAELRVTARLRSARAIREQCPRAVLHGGGCRGARKLVAHPTFAPCVSALDSNRSRTLEVRQRQLGRAQVDLDRAEHPERVAKQIGARTELVI